MGGGKSSAHRPGDGNRSSSQPKCFGRRGSKEQSQSGAGRGSRKTLLDIKKKSEYRSCVMSSRPHAAESFKFHDEQTLDLY